MTTRMVEQNDAREYQGYSSDTKPAAPNGSKYHVLDTGDVFVCHEGAWTEDLRAKRALKLANI